MLEHAIYTVISPEGAASILWRDAGKAIDAATNMRITAPDLLEMGMIDEIIPEPVGGAHRDPEATFKSVSDTLDRLLTEYEKLGRDKVRSERQDKYLAMGESKDEE